MNSEVGYLGYQGAEAYGISYKVQSKLVLYYSRWPCTRYRNI